MRRSCGLLVLVALWAVALGPPVRSAPPTPRSPGFVDGSAFLDLVGGDEAIKVQVSIHRSLIRLVCAGLEDELKQVVCGLDSINALILHLPEDPQKTAGASRAMARIERTLQGRGWERLAFVREADSEVRVLVLNDETSLGGLVVMVVDHDEGELVFANVAGQLDLAAIQRLGQQLGIPGLDRVPVDR